MFTRLLRWLSPVLYADGPAGGSPAATEELPFGNLPEGYFDSFMGSKEVNPTGRPIRPDVRGMTGDESLDDVLKVMGEEAYMTPKEIAAYEKSHGKPPEPKKEPEAKEVEKPADDGQKKPEPKPEQKPEGGDEEDPEVKRFYDETGLTPAAYAALPKAAQERLAKMHEDGTAATAAMKKELDDTKKLIEDIYADSVVRARLEERKSGRKYVAGDMPTVGAGDIDAKLVSELGLSDSDKAAVAREVNRLLANKVREAVKVERSIKEQESQIDVSRKKAWDVVTQLGSIDKRLVIENPDEAFNRDPAPGSELATLIKFVTDNGMSLDQITKLGPRKLYALYAEERGWSQERDKKIAETTKKSLLDRLTNPPAAKMKTLPQGRRPPTSESDDVRTEAGQEGLIRELLAGKTATLERLLDQHSGNPEMLSVIKEVQGRAWAEAKRRHSRGEALTAEE